jgi:hypothetical protein
MAPEIALRNAILDTLRADTALAAIVGDRVRDQPESGLVAPYVYLGRIESQPSPSCPGSTLSDVTVWIYVASEGLDRAAAWSGAHRVRSLLHDATPSLAAPASLATELKVERLVDLWDVLAMPVVLVSLSTTIQEEI